MKGLAGWSETTLGDVTSKIGSGATPAGGKTVYKSSGIPLIRSMNVHFSGFVSTGLAHINEMQAKKLDNVVVRPNDVLLNITGASIGRVTVAPPDMNGARVNQHVAIIRPVSGIESRLLAGFLSSPSMQRIIAEENYGVTRQALTKQMIESFRLPVPPLPEQRRIVAKIDSLSAKFRRARDHLDHIPRLVEKYKQATLAAAFRGDLTREWRQRERVDSTWPTIKVGDIIEEIVAGKNLRCEERPPDAHECGVVKVSAVTWGAFDARATKTLPKNFVPPKKTQIRPGDFLISRANTLELVGAVVLVKETPPNLFLSDKILRLDMTAAVKPWMLWFFRSPLGREAIEGSATGNQLSMRNLSQTALREIELPWPKEIERSAIIKRIENAFAWIDRLAPEATSARKLIDHLEQAVLAKAFRGELVPQDPNDEPASVLLERIRAERVGPSPKT